MPTNTKDFLNWIADIIVDVHKESPFTDYVFKLRQVASQQREPLTKDELYFLNHLRNEAKFEQHYYHENMLNSIIQKLGETNGQPAIDIPNDR